MDDMEKLKEALVVQSNKLIEASYRLRIGQQKFLRLMASRIKKDDEDFKSYEFKISDIMQLFDIKTQTSYTEIPKQLRELMGNVLTFKVGKTTTLVPFLAFAQHDDGSGIVKVQFHPVLKPMYLCLNKENPFTIYELSNALKLRSTYSLRVYELLKQYQKIGYRVLSIDDIRGLFELQPTEYVRYNDFKRFVIVQAQKEINDKTDICFDFEELKEKRKVISIRFIIKSNIRPIDEVCATKADKYADKQEKASTELIREIKAIFKSIVEYDLSDKSAVDILKCATKHKEYGSNPIDLIKEVAEYSKTQNIDKNFIGWFKNTVSNYEKPRKALNTDTFSNYDQRKYNFEELERKLLGWDSATDEVTGEKYLQGAIKVDE